MLPGIRHVEPRAWSRKPECPVELQRMATPQAVCQWRHFHRTGMATCEVGPVGSQPVVVLLTGWGRGRGA
ncbi:hypothetical protein P7K49_009007, partial [Saguinus oedipus]